MELVENSPSQFNCHDMQLPLLVKGAGPTLGYLHGPLGNPGTPEIVNLLAQENRVVAPTLPGFFGAEPFEGLRNLHDWISVLSEIIDSCGLAGKPVVASSITAMLALELAAIRPEAFEQLILIAPLGLWDAKEPVADLYACLSGEERGLLVADPESLAGIYEDRGITDAQSLVQRSVNRFVARATSASIIWPIPEFGLVDRIHRVKCPVTLIWGAEDRYVVPSYAARFAKLLPNPRGTHIVKSATHLVDLDSPGDVALLVLDALKREPVAA